MKELLLLRHAKSDWGDPSLADFDRPLSRRGRKAAPPMGRLLAKRGWIPDLALVSAAARTRQTWHLVSAELPALPAARFVEELYEASAETLLSAVRAAPADTRRLLVVGHNPGLEDLAAMLVGPRSGPEALARMREKFPTGALARFECGGEWPALRTRSGDLCDFLRPRDVS